MGEYMYSGSKFIHDIAHQKLLQADKECAS